MKRLRLDRLNMRLVVTIGLAIILIVTALFIVFRTNLIFDHRSEKVDEITVSDEAKKRKKNPEDLNIAEKKYLIEENVNEALKNDPTLQEKCKDECVLSVEDFLQYYQDNSTTNSNSNESNSNGNGSNSNGNETNSNSNGSNSNGDGSNSNGNGSGGSGGYITGCSGEVVVSGGVVDMTGVTCSSKNTPAGGNSGSGNGGSGNGGSGNGGSSSNGGSPNNPTYPDPDEPTPSGPITQEVKDRTKPASKLTPDEKKYVIDENVKTQLEKFKERDDMKRVCDSKNSSAGCSFKVDEFDRYTDEWRKGYFVEGCTGDVFISYDADKNKFSSDTSKVTCK